MLSSFFFILLLTVGISVFVRNAKNIVRNIALGKKVDVTSDKAKRWKRMLLLSLGQTKMVVKPIAGILHIIVYVGFFFVNLELLEITLDGIFAKHRMLSSVLGDFYKVLTIGFETFALLVIIAVVVFFIRRNVLQIERFQKEELEKSAKKDANIILITEFVLMFLFLVMNTSDIILQERGVYAKVGYFPIGNLLTNVFISFSSETLWWIERSSWWLHISGILFFLNYLYYSKHLHILSAFPYTYFSPVTAKGQFPNSKEVTEQVKLMLLPEVDPFSVEVTSEIPSKFGASDVTDLSWVQLLSAYACTECGRCTEVCPASITGKKLSPRKIMMKTRDRLEEVGELVSKNRKLISDGKQLLNDYISPEELWACTSCNACVDACPLEISPLSIIMEMRQYLVMEASAIPSPLQTMFSQIENNGSPWGYSSTEREQVIEEITSS